MLYPKIHSLYKRDKANKMALMWGAYSLPEFDNIKLWKVQEKIDGTNIRVHYDPSKMTKQRFKTYGRSDYAQIPTPILDHLESLFRDTGKLESIASEADIIWLFGEGYGPKIQKGGENYRDNVGFILFDVVINGIWLQHDAVREIAEKLGIPFAPIIGIMTTDEIVEYVKSRPLSLCSVREQVIEGVVCRPETPLLRQNGEPLAFKLKCRDFEEASTDNQVKVNDDCNCIDLCGHECHGVCLWCYHKEGK